MKTRFICNVSNARLLRNRIDKSEGFEAEYVVERVVYLSKLHIYFICYNPFFILSLSNNYCVIVSNYKKIENNAEYGVVFYLGISLYQFYPEVWEEEYW